MFKFTVGNILEADTKCLVNTVNCEGYMGKGIAYQFKLKFPENNREYIKVCKNKSLHIGALQPFWEQNKLIINFPTKDKWRDNSKVEYIEIGLSELGKLINLLAIESIAIPPLGCGNGGLNWNEIKPLIVQYLTPFANTTEILIYEPSKYFVATTTEPPKINASHLILMKFKLNLNKFNKRRLQKTAYFMNLFSVKDYFKFPKNKYGTYAPSVDILSKNIKEYQNFYNINTEEALRLAQTTIISKSIEETIKAFTVAIDKATNFVNKIIDDEELELLSTICSLLNSQRELALEDIIREVKEWSPIKAIKFPQSSILNALSTLLDNNIIQINLFGLYSLTRK